MTKRLWVQLSTTALLKTSQDKSLILTCLCHHAVHFGSSRGAVMLRSYEGKRRSGIAPAISTDCGISTYKLKALQRALHLQSYNGTMAFFTFFIDTDVSTYSWTNRRMND